MGYKDWRARQNARIDAMTARADERAQQARQRLDQAEMDAREAGAEAREVEAARVVAVEDAQLEAMRSAAAGLGEVHEDLVARAAAVGMGLPRTYRRRGLVEQVGEVLASDGAPGGSRQSSPYELWWGRIMEEERCAAKLARGQSLSMLDRARLRLARSDP